MKSGIYAIVNTLNGRRYIGSSIDMPKRFRIHRYYLDLGKHANRHLIASWKKYSADAFEFTVLEYVSDISDLHIREQWHLDQYRPHVYNVGLIAANPALGTKRSNGRLGSKHSEETKRRIAQSQTGKKRQPFSAEWRARLGAASRGKYRLTPEQTEAIAAKNRGQKRSPETRAKLRAARAAWWARKHAQVA